MFSKKIHKYQIKLVRLESLQTSIAANIAFLAVLYKEFYDKNEITLSTSDYPINMINGWHLLLTEKPLSEDNVTFSKKDVEAVVQALEKEYKKVEKKIDKTLKKVKAYTLLDSIKKI